MGKGDTRRPMLVDHDTFAQRWDAVFAPRVLIVCVYYDRPNMVRNALKSVREQTDARWYLAFIDDGSAVPGRPIVEDVLVGHLNRVSFYRLDDTPTEKDAHGSRHGEAMNRAIRECPGDLVVILCDDDALHEQCVERAIEWFDKNPDYMYGYGRVLEFDPFSETPGPHITRDSDSGLNRHRGAIKPSCQVDSTQVIYRAAAHREDGVAYPPGMTGSLDASMYEQLFDRYGACPPLNFVVQYKGWHHDQMCKRPKERIHVAGDIA